MITHRYRSILGDIPAGWDAVPLSKLLHIDSCQAGDWGEDEGEVAIRVVRSTNFTNDGHFDRSEIAQRHFHRSKSGAMNLCAGDILIEKSGGSPVQPVGRVLQLDTDEPALWFSNFIQLLRPNCKTVYPRFLFWTLHELHCSGFIERFQNQTTQMRNLELRDYLCAIIPLPSSEEQISISKLLDSVDDKISHTKEMIGIAGSLRRDCMQGPLNRLKSSLLHHLVLGKVRTNEAE